MDRGELLFFFVCVDASRANCHLMLRRNVSLISLIFFCLAVCWDCILAGVVCLVNLQVIVGKRFSDYFCIKTLICL